MASAWGNSWGGSWGNSWGDLVTKSAIMSFRASIHPTATDFDIRKTGAAAFVRQMDVQEIDALRSRADTARSASSAGTTITTAE